MKRSLLYLLFALLPAAAAAEPAEAPSTITLATLEWPPYAGSQLPEQGINGAVIRAAYQAMGYRVLIRVVPWQRAVEAARFNPQVAGYFPEYDSPARREAFIFSDPIGSSPLGLAERVRERSHWQQLAELARQRLGVVRGYVNTAELDDRIASGRQNSDEAQDDAQNLLKLDRRHIDLAVIDRNVFDYLLQNNPTLRTARGNLTMNPRLLEEKQLYVGFKRGEEGRKLADILNQGLRRIDAKAIVRRYLQTHDNDGPVERKQAAAAKKPAG
ncbi:substrate-binding periplasmic protein [Chromobacterium alticapitis]|uniref:substrate-binding periplasmic protein n=1 Tax=Chromobacterium alticapitis TaxID=2073169 RepID=UPI001304AF12|nr:transporter substrate-binding domain-containing protein [Chromobacterium alticapitis]